MSPKLPRRPSGSWPTWRSPPHSPWKGSVVLSRFATVRPPCRVVSGRSPGPATQAVAATVSLEENADRSTAANPTARAVTRPRLMPFFDCNMVETPPLRCVLRYLWDSAHYATALVVVMPITQRQAGGSIRWKATDRDADIERN